jgi:hypothetical protein
MGCYTNNDGGYRILIDTKVFCPTQNLCLHAQPANSCWQRHVWMFNTKSCDYETFFPRTCGPNHENVDLYYRSSKIEDVHGF